MARRRARSVAASLRWPKISVSVTTAMSSNQKPRSMGAMAMPSVVSPLAKGGEILDIGPVEAFAAQELVEVHFSARGLRRQQDACRCVRGETAQPCRRVACTVVGGQVGQFPAGKVDAMASPRGRLGPGGHARTA